MKRIRIRAKPNSREQALREEADGSLTVTLTASPIDGRANQELIKLVAKHFGVPVGKVRIKSGQTSKHKLVEIETG